ncbi:MAG TPA: S8 family serine peptidase [Gaiellaceae bacterium]|nr:S8 family serine peptidase [Gaiellaceae bacterium]
MVLLVVALALTAAASSHAAKQRAYVPASLLSSAAHDPLQQFHVIVQGDKAVHSSDVAASVRTGLGHVKRSFRSVDGAAATLSGAALLDLARSPHIVAITPDATLGTTSDWTDSQAWATSTGIAPLAAAVGSAQTPAIAIVDSGIDPSKAADFGSRLVVSVNLSSRTPDATGDDEGHGTMVAGVAAGASSAFPGAAPTAPIVSVRVSDGYGESVSSDVIAACDWVLAHKAQYDIGVVNLSLVESGVSTFRYNPLDQAVESLWLNGIVVTTAAGNYGNGAEVDAGHAPGNDPFVITVGALDQNGTASAANDTVAPWSAFGHTADGFWKPELSAPGRYIVAPAPDGSYIEQMEPDRVVAPGYMWMSGTSFAAPMAAGSAADLLALHPDWTPDQVKGALMVSAAALPAAPGFAGGVGEVDAAAANDVTDPPNPNANLDAFVTSGAAGPHFDADAWNAAVANASDWSASDWSASDWSASDWSASDWSASDWSASDWSASDWSASDWSASDWSASDWSVTGWLP